MSIWHFFLLRLDVLPHFGLNPEGWQEDWRSSLPFGHSSGVREVNRIFFVGEWVEKKKTDALNPLDLKEPDVRVVPDRRIHVATKTNQREKKTRSLLKLKPWQPNAYSTLVGLVWDKCLFFHVNLPTASLLLSRSTHTTSQLNRRGVFTVGRWLPTCMCGTTWPCRRWPGTSWWGWDGGRAGGRRACRAEGTWGFLTRPSNPWGRQQQSDWSNFLFFYHHLWMFLELTSLA